MLELQIMHVSLKSSSGKFILIATIIASGMAFLDGSVVNVALPKIQNDLNTNIAGIEWVVNSFALSLAALLLVGGALGDRFGRRKIFSIGIAIFTLSSIACGLSHNIAQLIASRTIQGIGSAMMIPGSLSIINSSFEENIRGKVIGWWAGLSGGIAAIGPFVGGFLVQTFSWQSIFWINVPLGILVFIISLKFVPESQNPNAKHLDVFGTILIAVALLGLSYGLTQGPVDGFKNLVIILSLGIGIVSFIVFLLVEAKVKEPIVPYSIFKSPLVVGANLATLSLYGALYAMSFFVVLDLQQVQGLTPFQAGAGLLPPILLITFLSGRAGSIADRIGPRLPMIIGPFLVGIGFFLLANAPVKANYFINFLPGLILFGTGMSIVIAPLTKSALDVPHELSGSASGVNNSVSRIAALLSIALLGAIATSLFAKNLQTSLFNVKAENSVKNELIDQSNRLGGIAIPKKIDPKTYEALKLSVNTSFTQSFRIIMLINSALAFLAAGISFLLIHNKKAKK